MEETHRRRLREGFLCGLVAYVWWGLVPLYFKAVTALGAAELLAHRIVWSVLFLALVLGATGRWGDFARCFRDPKVLRALALSTVLIAVNWFVYIFSVTTNRLVQASLGYFILPLVSVMLGLVVFKERLRLLQWIALALAALGVVTLTLAKGEWPWIALILAFSFAFYGLVRKTAPVDGLIGLSVEVALLLPPSAGYLLYLTWTGEGTFGTAGLGLDALVVLSGVVTAVPLLFFGQAARRLPLSTLGFLQYLSPTLALILAVALFGEDFGRSDGVSFGCIWAALAVFSVDTLHSFRRGAAPVVVTDAGADSAEAA